MLTPDDPRPHSVVIPAYNNADLTTACVDSIRAHSDTEIVVVDNGSEWPQPHGDITITVTPNRGFARACNIGASAAHGDIIVFLNNDTVVTENWLDELLYPFEDEAIGVTGARLTYPDGTLQHAGVTLDFVDGVLTAHNILTDEPSGIVAAGSTTATKT